jgi:hypothetical protein
MIGFKKCKPCDPHGKECGLDEFIEYYESTNSVEELTNRWKWANGLISTREYPKGEEISKTLKRNPRLAYVLFKVNRK